MTSRNSVVLVDESDTPQGTMEKLEAHQKGALHRAFSVLTFNSKREVLLQRRAMGKYHSGGLWTNTCCSHPQPKEKVMEAAHKRLQEEMGFNCPLIPAFQFIYRAELDRGLIENEYDHVFFGIYSGKPKPNPSEVMDFRYVSVSDLKKEIQETPEQFTAWFKIILDRIEPYLDKFQSSGRAKEKSKRSKETSAA